MRRFPARALSFVLLAVILLLTGCGDPVVSSAEQLAGSWRTYYHPQVIYQSDQCHGTLSPMVSETWEVYWEVTALNSAELDINMSWYPSNYSITDFACGASTGVFTEYSPIDHIYGYIDGNRLIISHNYSGAGGQKVISGNLRILTRRLEGTFFIDTYLGGTIVQTVHMSGQGLQIEQY